MQPTPDTLIYYPDDRPGIRRKRRGRGFTYLSPDGTRIDNQGERKRIEALAVPPAYNNVWISPIDNGHLQATGRDDRSRKQYRYHPDWTAFRAQKKYEDLLTFGDALPGIRRRVSRDLNLEAGEHAFALAAVVAMIDRLAIRVGNPEYADENGTFGATTLKSRHMKLADNHLQLAYRGKGNRRVRRHVKNQKLLKTLQSLDDLPGADLVTWVDEDGRPRAVTSDEVNTYLGQITGNPGLTAKTFRTWAGSVAALEAAHKADKVTIKLMAEAAAERLANTPTIARTSYIHPAVIALAEDDGVIPESPRDIAGLRVGERRLVELMERT